MPPSARDSSTAFQAIKIGRHGWGIELNRDYWRTAVGYGEAAENEVALPTLLDLMTEGAAA